MQFIFLDVIQQRHDFICLKSHSITNQRLVCAGNHSTVIHTFCMLHALDDLQRETYNFFSFDPGQLFTRDVTSLVDVLSQRNVSCNRIVLHGWDAQVNKATAALILETGYDCLIAPISIG